jgi:Flp pilus assembly protein TadD
LFHSLLGNHLFLSGDKKGARLRYEKALSLDPSNEEALAMIARLR